MISHPNLNKLCCGLPFFFTSIGFSRLSNSPVLIAHAAASANTAKNRSTREMGISFHTVSFHLKNIYEKLQVHSKTEAVAKALREKLV